MKNDDIGYGSIKEDSLLPVRAVVVGLPISVAVVAFLWTTGYPAEEWPIIAGVFTACLFGSGMALGYSSLFVVKHVARYGRRVAFERRIDPDTPETPGSARNAIALLYTAATCLLLTVAVWGVALILLILVMSRLDMAPLAGLAGAVAHTLLGVGMGGLVLVFGVPTAIFYLASDDSHGFAKALVSVRVAAVSALQGIEHGVPLYSGRGFSGVRLRS